MTEILLMRLIPRKPLPQPTAKPLYGVNLGGWLLIEKWMTPSLFKGIDAVDEYTFCQKMGGGLTQKLLHHRETFITQSDFAWLQLHGIEAVRLPVGYWVFGEEEPYHAAIDYVDKAFTWAESTGIKILLDLHGAPGSQNGKQESGRIGKIGWPGDKQNVLKTLQIIKRLAVRYKDNPALLGIELLNEPDSGISRRKLAKYYETAYRLIREQCGDDTWVVFSDNFKPRRWKRKLRGSEYANTYIDTHQYQAYTKRDQKMNIAGHLDKTLNKIPHTLAKIQKYHPVIIGEWSLALNAASLQNFNEQQMLAARRAYGDAQLITYEHMDAWFYWSYKTEDGGPWSFRDCIENGWLPDFKTYK
jgi:glucan 1,3-beta-glucosidase